MRLPILIAFLVLISSCSVKPDDEQTGFEYPPELESLSRSAISCLQDTEVVPFEHSEHCVIVAESVHELYRQDCSQNYSDDCHQWNEAAFSIREVYLFAANSSLLKFGASDELKSASERTIPFFVFFDGELMRGLFDECLRKEQAALAEQGLTRIHSISPIILEEGQACIREGYPDFKTEEI